MFIAALVFAGCQVLVFSCFTLVAVRWYHSEVARIRDELSETVQTFLTSPSPETPSPLAVIIDQVALLLAARMVQQVKAMLAGVESGESKGEQMALITEATGQSPWLALLSNILPKRIRNALMRNPQMVGALAKLGTKGDGAHSSGRSTSDSYSL